MSFDNQPAVEQPGERDADGWHERLGYLTQVQWDHLHDAIDEAEVRKQDGSESFVVGALMPNEKLGAEDLELHSLALRSIRRRFQIPNRPRWY
ncbi:MAG: hypothetical protein ACXWLH_02285 [Candidatus Saccharimonadales bacterium]